MYGKPLKYKKYIGIATNAVATPQWPLW